MKIKGKKSIIIQKTKRSTPRKKINTSFKTYDQKLYKKGKE
jgi:hypothetical protein